MPARALYWVVALTMTGCQSVAQTTAPAAPVGAGPSVVEPAPHEPHDDPGVPGREVTVWVTGLPLSINGTTDVPAGLFGVHYLPGMDEQTVDDWGIEMVRTIDQRPNAQPMQPGDPGVPSNVQQIVDCLYDRYQPGWQLRYPYKWRARLTKLARGYAQHYANIEHDVVLEFWNEPYINWAARPGVNYDGRFFADKDRRIDGPVHWRHNGRLIPELRWRRQLVAVRAGQAPDAADYLASRYAPGHLREGDEWTWREMDFVMREVWWARDVTQPSWYSGGFNQQLYEQMLVVFGESLREANPDVPLIAGWDFHFYQDNWAAWDRLHRPMIDAAGHLLDGLTEHHYGGDTRAVAGQYETAWAYVMATQGRSIDFYNTEAGGFADAERPGSAQSGPQGTPEQRGWSGSRYMIRDIVHLIDVCPDKAVARAAHHPRHYGSEAAFRLLRPLRGTLIADGSDDADLWVVSSINDENQLVVAMFNDGRNPAMVNFNAAIPEGTTLASTVMHRPSISADGTADVVAEAVQFEPGHYSRLRVPSQSARVVVLQLEGEPDRQSQVAITQHPADRARAWVEAGQELRLRIDVPADALEEADAARLKLVQSPWLRGQPRQWRVSLNGQPIDIELGGGWIHLNDLPVELLREQNVVSVTTAGGGEAAGFMVDALSIELESHRGAAE
jgi:hypothetical protein